MDEKIPHRVIQIRPGFRNNDEEIKQNKIKVHIRPNPPVASNYSSINPPSSYLTQNPTNTTLRADQNPTKANINT